MDSSVEVEKFMSLVGVPESPSKIGSMGKVEGISNGIYDLEFSGILGLVKDGMWV